MTWRSIFTPPLTLQRHARRTGISRARTCCDCSTSVRMNRLPAGTTSALLAAISRHLVPVGGSLPVAIGGKISLVGRLPPLPARYYARQGVLADITNRLSSCPVLILQGGTGVGKSIAAIAHAATSTSSWGWADLRGV